MKYVLNAALLLLPASALAQATGGKTELDLTGLESLIKQLTQLIDMLVPLVFAIAFIVFLWGVYLYFIQGGASEEKRETGKKFVLWAVIGFFLMASIWGIVNLLVGSLKFQNQKPPLPQFNTQNTGSGGPIGPTP